MKKTQRRPVSHGRKLKKSMKNTENIQPPGTPPVALQRACSAAALELDNVRDAIVTFDARGNRWNILKAICNPKRSIIKLVLPKSTIVISAKPQPNNKMSHGEESKR